MNKNRVFCGFLLKDVRKSLYKLIPSWGVKGIWTWHSKGFGDYYEVSIPKNDIFPQGYFWSGSASNSSDAKVKAFLQIIDRIENKIEDEKYPIKNC